jgi:hypothetical protein
MRAGADSLENFRKLPFNCYSEFFTRLALSKPQSAVVDIGAPSSYVVFILAGLPSRHWLDVYHGGPT